MATKNKNIKTHDLDSVFDEYTKTLSQENEKYRAALLSEIDESQKELQEKTARLNDLKKSLKSKQNARLDSRKSTDLKIKIENLQAEIKNLTVLSDEEREKTLRALKSSQTTYNKKNFEFQNHLGKDSNLTTEQRKVWDEKYEKLNQAVETYYRRSQNLAKRISIDDEKRETLKTKSEELELLKTKLEETINLENSKYNTQQTEIDEKFKQEFEQAKALSSEIQSVKQIIKDIEEELKAYPAKPKADLESFTEFLKQNKLSTVHAEELYNFHNNPEKFEKIAYDEFKMRKMHPKRDYFVKKVVVPTAITSAAIGASIGAIAGSGLVGGSTVLGFIPVSGTPGLTEMATTLTGFGIGLASTPTVIKTKNLITRSYYRLKAKSVAGNISDYANGTNIDNLNITKLIAQIENTKHEILKSKGAKKHILNTVNRNRIHQVEAYTKELLENYITIERDEKLEPKEKAEKLTPIYEMLLYVQNFISNDIAESKTHAMLTCKASKKDVHSPYMIENVDIYANLKIYLDRIAQIGQENNNRSALLKDAKKTTKNLEQKKEEAYKIINGERLISKMLNYETKYAKYVATPSQGIAVMKTSLIDEDTKIALALANGKSITISASDVDATKKISIVKIGKSKTTVTYKDGSTTEITKKVKLIPEIETARIALADKLINDPAFVEELKLEGFKTITINKLIEKITDWREHTDEKFSVSGKIKNLYTYAIDKINTETELVQSL